VNHPIATFEQRASFSGGIGQLTGRKVYISASTFADGPFRQLFATFTDDPAWRTYSVTSGHGQDRLAGPLGGDPGESG